MCNSYISIEARLKGQRNKQCAKFKFIFRSTFRHLYTDVLNKYYIFYFIQKLQLGCHSTDENIPNIIPRYIQNIESTKWLKSNKFNANKFNAQTKRYKIEALKMAGMKNGEQL